ncbi:hypothetical protein GDO78_022722 [Eleutherodactylus coqui]|uniref:Uncharacterized protein n=1 Tax=Eleutherodactylus coqui TaxID=57060 RepID=A0A8J6EMP0_ELECQ|nr:hypothetical protein GDO78_022722 [Eleutherodactylus coqui]
MSWFMPETSCGTLHRSTLCSISWWCHQSRRNVYLCFTHTVLALCSWNQVLLNSWCRLTFLLFLIAFLHSASCSHLQRLLSLVQDLFSHVMSRTVLQLLELQSCSAFCKIYFATIYLTISNNAVQIVVN